MKKVVVDTARLGSDLLGDVVDTVSACGNFLLPVDEEKFTVAT